MNEFDESPWMELYWPSDVKFWSTLAAIGGFAVMGFWGVRQMRGEAVFLSWKAMAFLCAAGPVGLGIFVSACQRVRVFSDRIENYHFGLSRTLEFSSTCVSKVVKNGYWLRDREGSKIFIHNWMLNSRKLFQELSQRANRPLE